MTISRSVVKMNAKESVVIVKWNGNTCCSLISNEDIREYQGKPFDPKSGIVKAIAEKIGMKVVEAKLAKLSLSEIENEFKNGDTVMYDGKPAIVVRAYVYKGKPYCILSDKRQVSASKLILNKPKK